MSERYALPRRESMWDMTVEDRARTEAINARLKPLVDSPISRPVTVTYWGSAERPIERLTFASQLLPSATGLMAAVYDEGGWEHIPRHDPARVLRDVEAKRQVLRLYTNAVSAVEHASGFQSQRTAIQDATCVEILGEALKSLALVWADHPDFRSEWCMADGGAEASE